MKKIIKTTGVILLCILMLMQTMGSFVYAAEAEVEMEDVDLENAESILSWIKEYIPEDLKELTAMPEEWWESLLPNQKRIAENLAMPAYLCGASNTPVQLSLAVSFISAIFTSLAYR